MTPHVIASGWLVALCIVAAVSDARYRTLSNVLCLVTTVSGLIAATLVPGTPPLLQYALHGLAALVIGMVLFRLGWVGGGDAKFYSAIAFWFPIAKMGELAIWICLAALALLIVWVTYRRLRGMKFVTRADTREGQLPFGVAIAAGAVIAFI